MASLNLRGLFGPGRLPSPADDAANADLSARGNSGSAGFGSGLSSGLGMLGGDGVLNLIARFVGAVNLAMLRCILASNSGSFSVSALFGKILECLAATPMMSISGVPGVNALIIVAALAFFLPNICLFAAGDVASKKC
jgi:hypothetical protein